MDITEYTDYFHDGNMDNITHYGNCIEFFIESFPIDPNEISIPEILSKDSTLKGKLVLKDIKTIKLENEKYNGILTKEYDDGEILDLEIDGNNVFFLVVWYNFPPKPRFDIMSKIEIEAGEVYWENTPNAVDTSDEPKFDWNDVVMVKKNAPSKFHPGEIASICGMGKVNFEDIAHEYDTRIGSWIYTIEFGNGTDVTISENLIEKLIPENFEDHKVASEEE